MKLYLKKVIGITVAMMVFYGMCSMLNNMYVPTGFAQKQVRLVWHYYYENAGKIDNLYLGSSHVYIGINAVYLDELNGQYNFNLASSTQPLNGSYYLLRKTGRDNPLSHVYVELYYGCHAKEDLKSDSIRMNNHRNWLNVDYMKNSLNKWEYMYSICNNGKFIDMMFPFVRYRIKLDNWEYVKQTMEEKRQDNYRTYQWGEGRDSERYIQQGYIY